MGGLIGLDVTSHGDLNLACVLLELIQREPICHRPELGTTRASFEKLTATDFREVSDAGQVHSRARVWSILRHRYAGPDGTPSETTGFHVRQLAPDVYLLTYTLRQDERRTRRLSIWQCTDDDWKVVYHQGTPVQDVQ